MTAPSVLPAPSLPPARTPPASAPPVHPLTRDMLVWLAARHRTYAETMEVWRTSCPRFSIWEDALDAGLVHVESIPGAPLTEAAVTVTARGRALLP